MGIDFRRPRHIRGFRLGEVLVWDFTSKPLVEKTVSGSVVAFSDGADAAPLKKCEITLPASLDGYSQVNVVHGGKNFLSSAPAETKNNNSVYITCDGKGKYTATGTATGGSANITFTLKTPCEIKSGMYLHLMNSPANANASVTFQKQDNTSIYAPALSPANRIINLSSYVGQVIYSIRLYVVNNASVDLTFSPMLCYSNTATTFEPYTAPTTHTASLGRTIYGGEVDVVNGQGESTHAKVKVSDLTWIKQTANNRDFFIAQVSNMKTGTPKNIASVMPYGGEITIAAMADKSLASWINSFRIYDTDITTVSELLETYGNDGISYPLATPETFTFDPVPIDSKLGNNTMWSDGDLSVTYYAYAD